MTNGIVYKFYTDLEETNKMDLTPFLEVDLTQIRDVQINELKKFCKDNFDTDKIFSTASELKYSNLIKGYFAKELESPSEEFTKHILTYVYEGQRTQKVIEKYRPLVKKAFTSFVNDIVNQKIAAALTPDEEHADTVDDEKDLAATKVSEVPIKVSKIVTTEEELQAFYIVRAIAAEITDIKKETLSMLENDLPLKRVEKVNVERDKDVNKYLFELSDKEHIEAVLMRHDYGNSICVSSQVGCNMGCKFCESGRRKKVRNLTAGEIVSQVLEVEEDINERITHVVLMGIGEPFDNFDNVINAIGILNNPKGLNIGARHISISTSGIVPKIYELADKKIQCTLSISLHATNDDKRSAMMPVNNAYPIKELMKACKYYIEKTNKRISFEYALAKDNNDNLEDAKELVKLLHGMLAHVNLIPINKIENGKFVKSTDNNIIRFRDYLNAHGIVATIRRELGSDIEAACGQLRRKTIEEKR